MWAAAVVALALCVPLSLACGALAGAVHLAAVAAAWLYNLRLKATALSWLPYVAGFGALPAAVALSLPGGPWPRWWTVTAGALLGFAAHLADTLPDIAADRAAGIRGLPHRLGARGTRLLLPAPLLGATAVLAFGPPGPVGAGVRRRSSWPVRRRSRVRLRAAGGARPPSSERWPWRRWIWRCCWPGGRGGLNRPARTHT